MNKEDYKLYTWYTLTDDEYWVDFGDYPDFENCQTLVVDTKDTNGVKHRIMTYNMCTLGWSTMAKQESWYFIIVEKPKN